MTIPVGAVVVVAALASLESGESPPGPVARTDVEEGGSGAQARVVERRAGRGPDLRVGASGARRAQHPVAIGAGDRVPA